MEELEFHLNRAEIPGDEGVVAQMHAYICEAQLVQKGECSLLQDAALMKWKTPSWVSMMRLGDPNAPVRVNMPLLIDSPEGWA
jgi:hypothetical protein